MRLDRLIGQRIVGIHVASWETGAVNHADFIYELSDGTCFRIPDGFGSVVEFTPCTPDDRHHRAQPSAAEREHYQANLFGRAIVDVLIPRDRGLRWADSVAIQLDSGHYVMQESGTPQGILPSVYLVDNVDSSVLQSVFATEEWRALRPDADTATEPSP